MTRGKKILLTVLIAVVIIMFAGGAYAYYVINSLTSAPKIEEDRLNINTNLDDAIVNIACFGIDGRDNEEVVGDRSDVIMIGTLNLHDNTIKLTSIMRDSYTKICLDEVSESANFYAGDKDGVEWEEEVETAEEPTDDEDTVIDEDGTIEVDSSKYNDRVTIDYDNQRTVAQYDKINAAYNEGGVESSILTLNTNFDLNIKDYITVDFECLMAVVDALGGIEVDVPNEQVLEWTNKYLQDSNYYGNRNDEDLTHTGVQTLTGAQALAFARIRYSDSDFQRSIRQREVVQAIFDKAKDMDLVTAINVLNQVYPYVKTSLSLNEITEYATAILNVEDITFEDYRIPTNLYGTSGFINETWYLFPDTLVDNCIALHKFIYGNDDYVPSNTVRQISQVINDILEDDAYDKIYKVGGSEEEKVNVNKAGTDTDEEETLSEVDSQDDSD